MTAVQGRDPAAEWRAAHPQETERIVTAAIAAIRDGAVPNVWLIWGVTGLTESEQRRYFPFDVDLHDEVRDRVVHDVVAGAAVDAVGNVRALTTWNIATALVDLAFNDRALYVTTVRWGLIEKALAPVAIVSNLSRAFPRMTVHADSLFRRAAHVGVIRAVIDQALALNASADSSRYELVEILDAFLTGIIRATAAS